MIDIIVILIIFIALMFLALLIYSFAVEPFRIEVNRIELKAEDLETRSFSILHISDLHLRKFGRRERKLQQLLKALNPEVILMTGDIIEDFGARDEYLQLLGSMNSLYGVFTVLGNNDYGIKNVERRGQRITKFLTNAGVEVLSNESLLLPGDIRIIGLDDPHKGFDDPAEAFGDNEGTDRFRIALAHSPETLDFILARQPDLILTGHTHGGQVRFPVIGSVFLNIKKGYRVKPGLNYYNGIPVYLSKGVGTTLFPIRFNCRPEITLITLKGI